MSFAPRTRTSQRGTALIEFAVVFPMLFFLFIGAFDLGFFCYAFISVESAVKVAALYTSSSPGTHQTDSAGACTLVLNELQTMPNYASLPSSCNATPLQVTATAVTAPDGTSASKVTVVYQTLQLIPIPVLPSRLQITRSVEMRVRS